LGKCASRRRRSFAALNAIEGKVIGRCMKRHRHQEFIRFLNVIDANLPPKKAVHVIVDNYAAHKHPNVLEWLDHHPRFVFHFTPTSASWLNAVEGLFATLTRRRLKRGAFRSLQELNDAIHAFIAETNASPKPFTWTKHPDQILAAVKCGVSSVGVDPLACTSARALSARCTHPETRRPVYRKARARDRMRSLPRSPTRGWRAAALSAFDRLDL
jgi:transposase